MACDFAVNGGHVQAGTVQAETLVLLAVFIMGPDRARASLDAAYAADAICDECYQVTSDELHKLTAELHQVQSV
jgi:hypothetical protein